MALQKLVSTHGRMSQKYSRINIKNKMIMIEEIKNMIQYCLTGCVLSIYLNFRQI
jgi:hypothetical protein